MTRKKFVKQLMALGYQRNTAEALAIYARCGGWTYEQYLEVERKYNGQLRALETAAGRMAARFAEGLEHLAAAVQKVADKVSEVFAGINMDNITTALDWVKENAPQIAEQHAGDALDALRYSCGIDLASGPDMTAHVPNRHQDGLNASIMLVDELESEAAEKRAQDIAEREGLT